MNTRKTCIAALMLAAGLSGTAQAALYDRGGGLIYDDVLDVTWLQDANYGAGSTHDNDMDGNDSPNITDGRMTWANAVAWAESLAYYDNVRNVVWDNWRLPTVTDTGQTGCEFAWSGGDCGYSVDTSTGEMAHLFYDELGNLASRNSIGDVQGGGGLVNVGPFVNLQSGHYWYGTEFARIGYTDHAWEFVFENGIQHPEGKGSAIYAMAVMNGDVAAIPEADTWAMLLAGLGLVSVSAVARRRKQSVAKEISFGAS